MTTPIGNYNTNIPTGINIQIFNPSPCECETCNSTTNYMTTPAYPANYYTNDFAKKDLNDKNSKKEYESKELTESSEVTKIVKEESKKIEEPNLEQVSKKRTVRLTDEYIKKLESYLSSKDVEKRIMAAKDILERVQEDESRKDNLALTALTNKMLKDPYQPIRFLALGILEERLITGNMETVDILKKVETGRYSTNGNTDQDAVKASRVLLKMTRKVQE